MGILKRFKDIMSANINALLDKAEDPEKMIDQYLRDMESDLGKVKAETAAVMADAEKAKRDLAECDAQISKMQAYAEKALLAGNEEDARAFLAKKTELAKSRETLQKTADATAENADKMRQMHDKLTKDIASLNERKASVKATVAAAKAQRMLDEANARAELNRSSEDTSVEKLAEKYDDGTDRDVDAELEALKKKLGM